MSKQTIVGALLFVFMLGWTAAAQSLNEQLTSAVSAGNKVKVEALIAQGADVNAKERFSSPPLYYAKDAGIAQILIAHGAKVNDVGFMGFSPLANAAYSGLTGVAELLIAKGADVNARGDKGESPLYIACDNKHTEMMALLITKGADVDARNIYGETPLFKAKDRDSAQLLITKGADVNARAKSGLTLLEQIVQDGQKDVAEVLVSRGADLKVLDSGSGGTLLTIAALFGHRDVVEYLIAKGLDINARDRAEATPLWYAVEGKSKEVVELLIGLGADPGGPYAGGQTLLQWACSGDEHTTKEIQAILIAASTTGNRPGDLQRLMTQFKGNSQSDSLRIAIINLAAKQHPGIPAEAEAAAGRGAYIFKNATSVDDTLSAAKEYLTAIEMAPWVANYYFNLCTVLEKSPYSQQALHACELYLVAAPNAADAGEMRQRIAGLHYAADRDYEQMKKRTVYIKSRGMDDLYRYGGISGTVSDKDFVLKLFVDWTASPPAYQIYAGCFQGGEIYGHGHDLVSTDTWIEFCQDVSLHLLIKPEGEGFVEVSDAKGGSLRATLDDLFRAKQKTMAQAVMFSARDDGGDRFYVTYEQGGTDLKHSGFLMFESDCNGSLLKKDPRALPDDFVPGETVKAGGYGRFFPEAAVGQPYTDICSSQFTGKTGYHFGETE